MQQTPDENDNSVLTVYTHLRVTESWRGHVSTIIWGGHCILGLIERGVQLFLGYSDQESINPRTEQPGGH